jgi:ankyrin repeat protein
MSLPPPPQGDDPIITQFRPQGDQWELTDENINRIDPKTGRTILHNYCQHINILPLDTFKMLIETHGADVNAQDDNQYTPLYFAIRHFDPTEDGVNTNVLLYLFSQKGVNGNIKDQNGCTVLHTACSRINIFSLDVFKLLIETIGCDVIAQDDGKKTPIHLALGLFNPNKGGNINVLTYLLSRVDTDLKDQSGHTLLHYACQKINILPINAFKVLVGGVRCDVNAQANDNDTPLHYALDNFNPRNGGDLAVLIYLASQQNVNINIKGQKGCNVLHLACINKLPDSKRSIKLKAENDTILCQIVEVIIERCVEQVLDELTL